MAVGGGSADQQKHEMLDAAAEFMSLPENRVRIKDLIGKGQRLSVNIDEIRQFNSRLS